MATHTPRSPMWGARVAASVRRTPHMLARLITHGATVLPAPTNTPLHTMAAANSGSANASMRSTSAPRPTTCSTGDMMPIITSAPAYSSTPITPITTMPVATAMRAKLWARSLRPAPRLCPMSVVAASPMPKPGM